MSASGGESIFAKPGVTFLHLSLHPAPWGDLQPAQGSAWANPSDMSSAPAPVRCPVPTATKHCRGRCCLPALIKP